MQLVFFLEEPSAKAFLDEYLPRTLPAGTDFRTIPHQGKNDLQKSLPKKLRAWRNPQAKFIVLQDKDSSDCLVLKRRLHEICLAARPDQEPLIRIACHELEAWYLGDFEALEKSFSGINAAALRGRAKYRDVDTIANAAEELKKIAPEYQKTGGSRKLGAAINAGRNTSHSFKIFIEGINKILNL